MQRDPHLLDELRRQVIRQFRDSLRSAVDDAFRQADDILFQWAHSKNIGASTQDCIHLMRMLRNRREKFVDEFMRQFDAGPSAEEKDVDAPIELALIDDDEFDLQGAVDSFVRSVHHRCDALKSSLQGQLRAVEGEDAPSISLHLSIENIAQAFRRGAKDLGVDNTMQIVLFKLFERCAAPALAKGYMAVSQDLNNAGFSPADPRIIVEHAPTPRPLPNAPPPAGRPPEPGSAAPHDPYQPHARPEAATQTVDASGMWSTLDRIARQIYAAVRPGAWATPGQAAPDDHVPPTEVQRYAEAQAPLMHGVLDDYVTRMPAPVMRQIIPHMARISAVQPQMLSDAQHPVRSLLDQIFVYGNDADRADDLALLPGMLEQLAASLELPAQWEPAVQALPRLSDVQGSVSESRRQRERNATAAAREWAMNRVEATIEDVLLVNGGERWYRGVFVPFLTWIAVKKGIESDLVHFAQSSMEDLLPFLSPRHVNTVDGMLNECLLRLVLKLRDAGATPDDLNRVSVRFRKLHAHAIRLANEPYAGPPVPDPSSARVAPAVNDAVRSTDSASHADSDTTKANSEATDRDKPEGPAIPADTPAPPIDDALRQVRERRAQRERLERFHAFLENHFNDLELWWRVDSGGGGSCFARLEAIPPVGRPFRFVPMAGNDTVAFTAKALLNSMLERKTRPLRAVSDYTERLRSSIAA